MVTRILGSNRLELVVDPWLEGFWTAIKEELSNMASKSTKCVKEEASDPSEQTPDPSTADVRLSILSIADSQDCESSGRSAKLATSALPDARPVSSSSADGEASQAEGASSADGGAASLTRSLRPLSESALNVPALPPPYLSVSLQESENTEDVRMTEEGGVCVIVWLKSHSWFSSDFWTSKQGESPRGAHIQGRSVDPGRFGQDSPPPRAGHRCGFEFAPQG